MVRYSYRKRFGLMMTGTGIAAISLTTNTLDGQQIVASTIMVLGGAVLFLIPQHNA